DGEMQRVDFNLGFYDYLTGLKPVAQARRWGPPAHDQRSKYVCVAPLAAPDGLGLVDDYRRLREVTSAPAQVGVAGPYTPGGRRRRREIGAGVRQPREGGNRLAPAEQAAEVGRRRPRGRQEYLGRAARTRRRAAAAGAQVRRAPAAARHARLRLLADGAGRRL